MMTGAEAPMRLPHAVVPHGQIPGDDGHAVVPPGDEDPQEALPAPNVEQLRKMFDEARDNTDPARTEQQKDCDYYDGPGQASPEVRATLKARGQPLVIDNRIAPAIDGILGVLEAGKTDPRAFPRNPEDQKSSEVATKTLRYIADTTKWNVKKMDCAEDYLKQGIAAAIVEFDGRDIKLEQIRWETFFYDPKSRKADFSDAKFLGIAKWMYADEVQLAYGERYQALGGDITSVAEGTAVDNTWDDRPNDSLRWVDRRRNRAMVVEIYYRHARVGWMRCVFCAAGWLEYGASPYTNAITGETRCPIEAQSFKVDRENNRYGPIRNMRSMQDEVNARRSRGLHLVNNMQIQQTDPMAPPVDADIARKEAARADGVIPGGWQKVPTNDMASGNLAMLQEAKDSLGRMVPVALAQDLSEGSAVSGRSRQVAQQAGLTQFGRGFGRFEDFEERIYQQMWHCAQQFWTGPMYIRVTDNPRAPEFLQINEPVMGQVMQQQPVVDPATGQPAVDPMTGQPMMQQVPGIGQTGVENRIAAMDMDIIISATPDTVALEQEVYESVMELVRSGIDPFSPVFQIMLELAPLPDKTRLMERIEAIKQEVGAQQQATQQADQAQKQADLEEQGAKTAGLLASAHKTAVDADNAQVELFTSVGLNPLLALADNQPPEQPMQAQQPQVMPQMMPG